VRVRVAGIKLDGFSISFADALADDFIPCFVVGKKENLVIGEMIVQNFQNWQPSTCQDQLNIVECQNLQTVFRLQKQCREKYRNGDCRKLCLVEKKMMVFARLGEKFHS